MNKTLYSNKIDQLFNALDRGFLDNDKVLFYKYTIRNINDFQKKEKLKIEHSAEKTDGRIKSLKNHLNYINKNVDLNCNNVKDEKLRIKKEEFNFNENMNLYEYNTKNYDAQTKKKIEKINNMLAERYNSEYKLNKKEKIKIENKYYSSNKIEKKKICLNIYNEKSRNINFLNNVLNNRKFSKIKIENKGNFTSYDDKICSKNKMNNLNINSSMKGKNVFPRRLKIVRKEQNEINNDNFAKINHSSNQTSNILEDNSINSKQNEKNFIINDKNDFGQINNQKILNLSKIEKGSESDKINKTIINFNSVINSKNIKKENHNFKERSNLKNKIILFNNKEKIILDSNKNNFEDFTKNSNKSKDYEIDHSQIKESLRMKIISKDHSQKNLDENFIRFEEKEIITNPKMSNYTIKSTSVSNSSHQKNIKTSQKIIKSSIKECSNRKNSLKNVSKNINSNPINISENLDESKISIEDPEKIKNEIGQTKFYKEITPFNTRLIDNMTYMDFNDNKSNKLILKNNIFENLIDKENDKNQYMITIDSKNTSLTDENKDKLIRIEKNNEKKNIKNNEFSENSLSSSSSEISSMMLNFNNPKQSYSFKEDQLEMDEYFNLNVKSDELKNKIKNINYKVSNDEEINHKVYIDKINRNETKKKIPFFKNQSALNNYLIRDFKIGSESEPKSNSLNKYKITENFDEYKEKKREIIKKLNENTKNNETKEIIINDKYQIKEDNEFSREIADEFNEEKLNLYLLEKAMMDKKKKEEIKEKSKKIADRIIELNHESYETLDSSIDNNMNKVSKKNIDKVIKLRNILKSTAQDDLEYVPNSKVNNVRRIKEETEDLLTITLHKLGPPGFLKTKFKNQTVKKYQTVNGKYFGC